MSIFDKSRHKSGRILKASNAAVAEFGNMSQIWEIGSDQMRGFGFDTLPGFKISKSLVAAAAYEAPHSYAEWEEITETSLATGSDGTNLAVFICSGGLGQNEIFESGSGLSEANRTATDVNANIPGAVDHWRMFDTNNEMSLTTDFANQFLTNGDAYTVAFHIANWDRANNDGKVLVILTDASVNNRLIIQQGTGGTSQKLLFSTSDNGTPSAPNTTNAFPTEDTWVVIWKKSGNNVNCGWVDSADGNGPAGQPLADTEFNANDMCTSGEICNFNGENFAGNRLIGEGSGGGQNPDFDLKTVIFANTCLIS